MAETISYALSLLATVLGIIEPFNKNMRMVLAFSCVGNFAVAISYLLVGSISGAIICFIGGAITFINFFFAKRGKDVPLWLVIIYAVVFAGASLPSFAYWYDAVSLVAAIVFVLSVAQPDPKYYRIFFILNSGLWIAYDFFAKAYGNLFTHVTLFVAIFVSIIIRDGIKKKNK